MRERVAMDIRDADEAPKPQLGLSRERLNPNYGWEMTVSQSPGEIITLADSVVPTGVRFGNLAAVMLRCLPLFSRWNDVCVQCDTRAGEKERRNVQVLYLKRGGVLAQIVARQDLMCRDA